MRSKKKKVKLDNVIKILAIARVHKPSSRVYRSHSRRARFIVNIKLNEINSSQKV